MKIIPPKSHERSMQTRI